MSNDKDWWLSIIACPDCGSPIGDFVRISCACGYATDGGSPLNLLPRNPNVRNLQFDLDVHPAASLDEADSEIPVASYDGPAAVRDSGQLFSAALPYLPRGSRLLDLGCGPRDQSVVAEYLDLDYVAMDFSSNEADIKADAHAIPFQPEAFDAVFAYAVLEHLHNPFVAAAEITRVLRPGGIFFGTVSQGEPFHDSYFHHTAWGTAAVLNAAGLRLLRIWPSYDTLHGLSKMGRYSRPVKTLIETVHRFSEATPFLTPRRLWRWSERERRLDRIHRAASLCFVARKLGGAGF